MKKLIAEVNIGQELLIRPGVGVEEVGTIGSLVSVVLRNVYVFAGIILLFLLIFGGIGFIVNAGGDNPEGTAKARGAITAALVGFLIIFASYWIIQIIEVITGLNILNLGN